MGYGPLLVGCVEVCFDFVGSRDVLGRVGVLFEVGLLVFFVDFGPLGVVACVLVLAVGPVEIAGVWSVFVFCFGFVFVCLGAFVGWWGVVVVCWCVGGLLGVFACVLCLWGGPGFLYRFYQS